ncbi:MAG TPA: AMP-binding protein [Chloroflexota bacterium]|nr:AMP-binding protein [Chloroflexota bacterium]
MADWLAELAGKTIAAALDEAAAARGATEAFVFSSGERLTFRDLQARSREVARAFLAQGIGRGDRVAIWMAGYPEWAELYFGLARIGAVMVPVNTRFKPAELSYVLGKSRAQALVFRDEEVGGKDYAAILQEVRASEDLPALRTVIAMSSRNIPATQRYVEFVKHAGALSSDALTAAEAQVSAQDTALIQFTSGTTAFPKGAQLFQEAMLRGSAASWRVLDLSDQDRFFSPQPFYHCGGSIAVMLCPLLTGCPMVVQAYFDATEALRLMEAERCTATMGHQPHFIEYLNHSDLSRRRLGLRKGMVFASKEVNQMVHERMGIEGLSSAYGMTETHLAGTGTSQDDPLEVRIGTVGRPMDGVEMELRDVTSGETVSPGERGEVHFRGWCTMRGYYDDPERTAEAMADGGWLRTGDLGVVGDDGNLRLIGRVKEMVRVGGENVAAAEVEGFLLQHPAVKQAVFVGRPELRLGEVGVAFVELKAGASAEPQELIDYCRSGLATFKVPREVKFVSEWPMSGTGKIQRFLLKEQAG